MCESYYVPAAMPGAQNTAGIGTGPFLETKSGWWVSVPEIQLPNTFPGPALAEGVGYYS